MKIVKKDTPEQNAGRKIKVNTSAKQLNELNESEDVKNTTSQTKDLSETPLTISKVVVETSDKSGQVASDLRDKLDVLEERRRKRKVRRRISTIIKIIIVFIVILAFIINPTLNNWITVIFNDLKDLLNGVIAGEDVSNNEILYHLFSLPNATTTTETYIIDDFGNMIKQ